MSKTPPKEEETLLVFPCEFPIKILGHRHDEFEIAVISIIRKHVPTLTENAIRSRESKQGKYQALTIVVTAESKQQLDAIYLDLTACEFVLMAL